ncbi:MAG: hypothetical protein R2873_07260 [Caldilineaceae bacterium]
MTTSLSPEEERARKREAIGLDARRPTARNEVQRPPESGRKRNLGWWAVFLMLVVGAATAWMLYDATEPANSAAPADPAPHLILDDDFTRPHLDLGTGRVEGQWDSGFADGVYRIQIQQPGNLTWSTLGLVNVSTYRLETALTLDGDSAVEGNPALLGYGALLVRYNNERNFYLFSVDAQGSYQVQLQRQEIWQILQPWTASSALRGVGDDNRLVIEDDGSEIRFFANGELLYTVTDPRLPAGDVALGGGARSQGTVSARFDWVRVFALPAATLPPP